MKSWAEACSSDDEDSEEEVEVEEVEEVVETTKSEEHHPQPQKEEPSHHHHHHPQKEYIFPTEPPFKAYVGNVAFVIKEDEHLANEIKKLCLERLQTNIKVVKAKLAQDRSTGQMRGFGYVEVETLEMLQTVLKLNDGKSQIAGRNIHLDVAQPGGTKNHRSSGGNSDKSRGGSDNDGSSFRSGRFSNNGTTRPSSFRRGDAGVTNGAPSTQHRTGSFRRDGETITTNNGPTSGGQRPTLKLKPRSQGVDATGSTNSEIFGGGKKQDVGAWEQRRQSETKESRAPVDQPQKESPPATTAEMKDSPAATGPKETKEEVAKPNDRGGGRQSGRGGRGAGGRAPREQSARGGRGGRTGGRGSAPKDGKKADVPKPATKAPAPVPVTKPTEPEKKPKVVNKFSLLSFGDDSDSD